MGELVDRYSRQRLVLTDKGQKKVEQSTIAIVGVGALGSASATYLTRAGVGKIILIDRDVVELSNLARQILYTEKDVETSIPKAIAAEKYLSQVNKDVTIETVVNDFNGTNALSLLENVDAIVDGTDNFETRYLLNEVSISLNIPFFYGAVLGFNGAVSTFIPEKTACFHCVFPKKPQPGELPNCETDGVIGPLAGLISTIQSTEVLKYLSGNENLLSGKLIYIHANPFSFDEIPLLKEEGCSVCKHQSFSLLGKKPTSSIISLCGQNAYQIRPEANTELNLTELEATLDAHEYSVISSNKYLLELTHKYMSVRIFKSGQVVVKNAKNKDEALALAKRFLR